MEVMIPSQVGMSLRTLQKNKRGQRSPPKKRKKRTNAKASIPAFASVMSFQICPWSYEFSTKKETKKNENEKKRKKTKRKEKKKNKAAPAAFATGKEGEKKTGKKKKKKEKRKRDIP